MFPGAEVTMCPPRKATCRTQVIGHMVCGKTEFLQGFCFFMAKICSSDMRNLVFAAKAPEELGGESRRNWSFSGENPAMHPAPQACRCSTLQSSLSDFPLTDPSVPACRCSPVLMFTLADVAQCQCSPNTVCRCI